MTTYEKIKAAAAEIDFIMCAEPADKDMSELEPEINKVLNEYDIYIEDLDLFYDRINRMDINSVIIKNIIEELWEQ